MLILYSTGIPRLTRFLWQPKYRVRQNWRYAKPTFALSNPSPSAVFDRISRGLTHSDLQTKKFALSETALWETALWETALAEGCL